MNLKGQGTLEILIGIPVVIIGLLVFFVILEPVAQTLFLSLDTANSAVITNITTIKLLVGIVGLIVVAMTIVRIVNSFRQPRFGQGGIV